MFSFSLHAVSQGGFRAQDQLRTDSEKAHNQPASITATLTRRAGTVCCVSNFQLPRCLFTEHALKNLRLLVRSSPSLQVSHKPRLVSAKAKLIQELKWFLLVALACILRSKALNVMLLTAMLLSKTLQISVKPYH